MIRRPTTRSCSSCRVVSCRVSDQILIEVHVSGWRGRLVDYRFPLETKANINFNFPYPICVENRLRTSSAQHARELICHRHHHRHRRQQQWPFLKLRICCFCCWRRRRRRPTDRPPPASTKRTKAPLRRNNWFSRPIPPAGITPLSFPPSLAPLTVTHDQLAAAAAVAAAAAGNGDKPVAVSGDRSG